MFRLPVCPHCETVYRYKEVKENKNKKEIVCYHCKKKFRPSKSGYCILGSLVIMIAVTINVALLNTSLNFLRTIIPITIVSTAAVLIAKLLTPFFISYRKK